MKIGVDVEYLGIPHWLAVCQDCDWSDEFSSDRTHGYAEVRRHVKKTGHTVTVEATHVTHYIGREEE